MRLASLVARELARSILIFLSFSFLHFNFIFLLFIYFYFLFIIARDSRAQTASNRARRRRARPGLAKLGQMGAGFWPGLENPGFSWARKFSWENFQEILIRNFLEIPELSHF